MGCRTFVFSAALLLAVRGEAAAAQSPRTAAPIDLTGYWVSIVTEDWRFRMVTPPKGDYSSVPINDEGRRVANTWDSTKDEAAGNQCKPYGAAAIMRMPGRVHITWEGDTILRMDTDAGMQARLLQFGDPKPPTGERPWQGHSAASWNGTGSPGRGSLKVVTSYMRPGYLRKNGVPYSENAVMTEYFDRHTDYGVEWFTVTTIIEDSKYLTQPFITSTHFRREPDGSRWNPSPCETTGR